jgi:hypothetical protein
MRTVSKSNFGYRFRKKPMATSIRLRQNTCAMSACGRAPREARRSNDSGMATPMQNRKAGATMSISAPPSHRACTRKA